MESCTCWGLAEEQGTVPSDIGACLIEIDGLLVKNFLSVPVSFKFFYLKSMSDVGLATAYRKVSQIKIVQY